MFSSFCELLAKLLASLLDRTGVKKKTNKPKHCTGG